MVDCPEIGSVSEVVMSLKNGSDWLGEDEASSVTGILAVEHLIGSDYTQCRKEEQ
jgi:hypothetical protein